jgi:TPR repeat protein
MEASSATTSVVSADSFDSTDAAVGSSTPLIVSADPPTTKAKPKRDTAAKASGDALRGNGPQGLSDARLDDLIESSVREAFEKQTLETLHVPSTLHLSMVEGDVGGVASTSSGATSAQPPTLELHHRVRLAKGRIDNARRAIQDVRTERSKDGGTRVGLNASVLKWLFEAATAPGVGPPACEAATMLGELLVEGTLVPFQPLLGMKWIHAAGQAGLVPARRSLMNILIIMHTEEDARVERDENAVLADTARAAYGPDGQSNGRKGTGGKKAVRSPGSKAASGARKALVPHRFRTPSAAFCAPPDMQQACRDALEWMDADVAANDTTAMLHKSECLLEGRFCFADMAAGDAMLLRATELGSMHAATKLGDRLCTRHADGVENATAWTVQRAALAALNEQAHADSASAPDANASAPDASASASAANASAPDASASAPDASASAPDANASDPDANASAPDASAFASTANASASLDTSGPAAEPTIELTPNGAEYLRGLALLRKAAAAGHAQAALFLGVITLSGNHALPVPESVAMQEAADLFERACVGGSAAGAFFLGNMYLYGSGVKQDTTCGLQLLTIAAQRGSKEALNTLETLQQRKADFLKKRGKAHKAAEPPIPSDKDNASAATAAAAAGSEGTDDVEDASSVCAIPDDEIAFIATRIAEQRAAARRDSEASSSELPAAETGVPTADVQVLA